MATDPQQLAAEHAEYIRRIVAEAPPLTDRRREKLATLLRPGVLAYWRHHRARPADSGALPPKKRSRTAPLPPGNPGGPAIREAQPTEGPACQQ